jgi:hypothetical protein
MSVSRSCLEMEPDKAQSVRNLDLQYAVLIAWLVLGFFSSARENMGHHGTNQIAT